MDTRRYLTNENLTRRDGQLAFSPQARGIADKRTRAKKGGRIGKILGSDDTFSEEFKAAFHPDTEHLWILERVNLAAELNAARKIRRALGTRPDDAEAQQLLRELNAKPTYRKKDCFLCPIWRHERELSMIRAAVPRYVFRQVRDQLFLVTIIFGFAENLEQLEAALLEAHTTLRKAVADMGRKRRGIMMIGSFEPDLKSYEDLTTETSSVRLLQQLGIRPTETGGWTLTGHFLLRMPHREVLEQWLRDRYPATGWTRVQFKQISKSGHLLQHLSRILSYAGKLPKPLFDPPSRKTKDRRRQKADKQMERMSAAFHGARVDGVASGPGFDLNAAIVQWSKFVSRMGPKRMFYSVESAHAQKWLSQSEMEYLRMTDEDMFGGGLHKIEIHRDHDFFPPYRIKPHLKGRIRTLRSRRLTHDSEWEEMTDCSGIDPSKNYPDFERWLLK